MHRAIRGPPDHHQQRDVMNFDYYMERANTYHNHLNELEKAIDDYGNVIAFARKGEQKAIGYLARADAFWNKGDLEKAIEDLEAALKSQRSYSTYLKLGRAYRRNGAIQASIETFSLAIEMEPSLGTAFEDRCLSRVKAGELQLALGDCEQAVARLKNSASTLTSRGSVRLKMGAVDKALADYDAALNMDDSNAVALFGRGLAKQRRGDQSGGEDDKLRATSILPDVEGEFAGFAVEQSRQ